MKLYTQTGNPTGRKVAAVCHQLGLDFTVENVSIEQGDLNTDAFRKLNPSGLIPVLVDGDRVMTESSAILIWLATEKCPGSALFPRDQQSEILKWMFWEASQFNAVIRALAIEVIKKPRMELRTEPVIVEDLKKKFARWAAVLNTHLQGRDFVVGEQCTLADYAIGFLVPGVRFLQLDLQDFPELERYYTTFEQNPHWQATSAI